jgi:hypothetical protein
MYHFEQGGPNHRLKPTKAALSQSCYLTILQAAPAGWP